MAKKRPAPRLFDVLPARLMRQSLAESLPDGTKSVWELVGSIRVTGGVLGAMDAGSCHPRHVPGEATQLDWPYPQADLAVRFAEQADGTRSRVLAVLVMAPADQASKDVSKCELEFTDTMSIDSATGVVGDYARMLTECRAGGSRATVLVGKGRAKLAAQKRQRKQAVSILKNLGMPVAGAARYDGADPVRFSSGLSDEQIERARGALAAAKVTEEIWVPSAHTATLLGDQLRTSLLAWCPEKDDAFLLAFQTGFGDGMYEWHAITVKERNKDRLCGYLCDFLPAQAPDADEEAEGEDGSATPAFKAPVASPAVRSSPVFPAELAPPLEPGINVAAKFGGLMKNWFLAELVRKSGAGFSVRVRSKMANPNQGVVKVGADEVVPMPNRAVFKVGDVVVAHCGDGSLQPAVVRSVSPKACQVEWHAKEPPIAVPVGQLTFAEWLLLASSGGVQAAAPPREREAVDPPAPADAAAPFCPGVAVAVRKGKDKFFLGRITKEAKGGYMVRYPSGDTAKVKLANLVPVPDRHIFRSGDAVIAAWSNAAMRRGRIAAMSPAGYTITWDDGFGPHVVPLGSLTFTAWA